MTTGSLKGIAIRSASRAPMSLLDSVEISPAGGTQGDFRGKHRSRQVTLLSVEDWQDTCAELGEELHWTVRRANLLVEGMRFENSTKKQIQIGEVLLEVTGETDPCDRMDEAAPGLYQALLPQWRGGACCRVIKAGTISLEDEVRFASE